MLCLHCYYQVHLPHMAIIIYSQTISLYITFSSDILLITLCFVSFTLDGSLNCKRAIVQCTDIIVESNIDPIVLARKLYSKEIISEDVYKVVKDKKTGDTSTDRLDYILDDLKDHVKHNASAFMIFLDILRDDTLNRQDLADKIMSKYKGMIH